jgi:acetyl esterase
MAALARGEITDRPPRVIAVMGDSAGGALAATLAVEYASAPGRPELAAQVLLYPVTDLTMSSPSYDLITDGFPLSAPTMRWFAGLYAPPERVDPRDPSVSPLFAQQPSPPAPAYVCTVGLDPLSEDGRAFAEVLRSAGGSVQHRHLPQHPHGLFTSAGRVQTGRDVLDEVIEFLCRELASPHVTD